MKTSEVAGLIFANSEGKLKKLTTNRSAASVPFGARYRIVDFALSNLVNKGVTSVGIITNENYRSLMDHVGSGVSWDLDRKNGGIFFLPPYFKRGVGRFNTSISSLAGASDYIKRCGAKYIVLYNSNIIANVDIAAACKQHIDLNSDVTVVYHTSKLPEKSNEQMIVKVADNSRITGISFEETTGEVSFGIGVTIVNSDLLLEMIKDALDEGISNFARAVLANKTRELKMHGFEHKEYVAVMDNTATYFESNMDLLNNEVRKQLFNHKRPILTKVHDGMPTRYGIKSKVNNSLVADNCIIEGTVKNSIIFRNVKIGKGAVVENSILMQGAVVGENATLDYVIADKNTIIGTGLTHKGTKENLCFFEKNQAF